MAREQQEEVDAQSIRLGSMYFKDSNPNGKDLEQFESGVFDRNAPRTRTSTLGGPPKITSSFFLTKQATMRKLSSSNAQDGLFHSLHESKLTLKREQDKYWKERVELLLDDKKKWMKEKKEMHQQISKLTDTIQRLELRHKKMHQVVSNLGFDEDDY
mgnify:CR=1 FL=1